MSEIAQRLKETSENCVSSYEAWEQDQKNSSAREALMEAVHELRKVAARLEIEIAVSERNEMASKPIPIPPHRSSRKRHNDDGAGEGMPDSNESNVGNGGKPKVQRRRRPSSAKGGE